MTNKADNHNELPEPEAMKATSEPVEDNIVSDEQLDDMAGGFNPQPDPPGFQQKLMSQINQMNKFLRP